MSVADTSRAFDPSVRVDRPEGASILRKRRILYSTTSAALGLLIVLAVVDGAGVADIYGVDTAHARSAGGGYELDVRYATVSRPGIATPLDITVRRLGGFDGPVTVAISSDYLSMWDENGLDPDPESATTTAASLVWEFGAPARGDTLAISFDARIEPSAQRGKPGRVAVLDDDGAELAVVEFYTTILP